MPFKTVAMFHFSISMQYVKESETLEPLVIQADKNIIFGSPVVTNI